MPSGIHRMLGYVQTTIESLDVELVQRAVSHSQDAQTHVNYNTIVTFGARAECAQAFTGGSDTSKLQYNRELDI